MCKLNYQVENANIWINNITKTNILCWTTNYYISKTIRKTAEKNFDFDCINALDNFENTFMSEVLG